MWKRLINKEMSVAGSFFVGIIASSATSFMILERLRDRSLLFEAKFDDREITSYVYKMVCRLSLLKIAQY